MLHDVTVIKTKKYGCAKVMGVPPEEFGIERNARSIRDCNYCFHQPPNRTEAELIAQGYPEDVVQSLQSDTGQQQGQEQLARDTVDENSNYSDARNRAARRIKVTEHYVRMNYEGDKARLYKVTTAGDEGTFLQKEGEPVAVPVDVIPFAAMTPVIVTHRFWGRSIADLVMDIQRIKTALIRAMHDAQYLANNPRIEVPETHAGQNTLDDLLISRPGGIVRTKQPGGLSVIQHPAIGGDIMPMIQYWDATREWRTGVTRQGQGISANVLQEGKQLTATEAGQGFSAAQARMKLIARIFAETGVKDLFSLLHMTIRKNETEENTVRLRNRWEKVNPREWKSRQDMTINVGLGHGNKDMQIAMNGKLLEIQEKIVVSGGAGVLVTPGNIYAALKDMTKLIGKKSVEPYFTDPDAPGPDGQPKQPPQPPPNPEVIKAQAQMQLEQQKMQLQQQAEAQKLQFQQQSEAQKAAQALQLEQQKMQLSTQLEQEKLSRQAVVEQQQAQADIATQERKTQSDIELARERFALDKELKLLDFQLKQSAHQQDMRMKQYERGLQARANEETGEEEFVPAEDVRHAEVGNAFGQLTQHLAGLTDMMRQTHDNIGKTHETIGSLHAAITAPRKKTIVRHESGPLRGRASHAIDEIQ
jgi:hypothetical protein